MSQLREYRQKRALLEQLQAEIDSLEQDPGFKGDLEFLEKLKQLKDEYNKSDREVMDILNPPAVGSASQNKGQRKTSSKLWRNPHTGEEVKSKNLLNKRLQEWIDEHGREEVRSWVVADHRTG